MQALDVRRRHQPACANALGSRTLRVRGLDRVARPGCQDATWRRSRNVFTARRLRAIRRRIGRDHPGLRCSRCRRCGRLTRRRNRVVVSRRSSCRRRRRRVVSTRCRRIRPCARSHSISLRCGAGRRRPPYDLIETHHTQLAGVLDAHGESTGLGICCHHFETVVARQRSPGPVHLAVRGIELRARRKPQERHGTRAGR